MGIKNFTSKCADVGVDGLIIVDLQPEEDSELYKEAKEKHIDLIRLVTPTTDEARLPHVLRHTSGFVYYVSIAGITGTRSAKHDVVRLAIDRLRRATDLPLAVGFGIKTATQVNEIVQFADAAVVGSALVNEITRNLDADGNPLPGLCDNVTQIVQELAAGTTRLAAG